MFFKLKKNLFSFIEDFTKIKASHQFHNLSCILIDLSTNVNRGREKKLIERLDIKIPFNMEFLIIRE